MARNSLTTHEKGTIRGRAVPSTPPKHYDSVNARVIPTIYYAAYSSGGEEAEASQASVLIFRGGNVRSAN